MFQMTLLFNATLETIYMVFFSGVIATLIGLPWGIALYASRKGHIFSQPMLYQILAFIANIVRSIPFIILMIAVIPMTRILVGSSIGTTAAIVPLSFCAMPFIARVVENALLEVDAGLIEAATAMGANAWQIVCKVLIPEALPGIIHGLTLTGISLIGYSAMAGAVGGGGLGDLAIRYGYQRFDTSIMLITIIVMIVLVQAMQLLGDKLVRWYAHSKQ
ncbi:MAG: ABC-type transporter, integral rane subunit [Gammaproteobacteria bacterium]|jgi:D-methionine transport system permease protein|nr:ABC-type transporter, integral rane subunit [Gammaproteobacteria bacterium]